MSVRVGICDSNIRYSLGFMEYMNLFGKNQLKVFSFSEVSAVQEYLVNHSLDILMIDESYLNYGEWPRDCEVIFLTENEILSKEKTFIFKYQNMDLIAEILLQKHKQKVEMTTDNSGFIAVYSPLGRCGKTHFALSLCSKKSNYIYVGFEEYSSFFEKAFSEERRCQVDEFLYYLLSHNEKIMDVIETVLKDEQEVKMLHSFHRYSDLKELKRKDFEWFLGVFLEKKIKGKIVFDIGGGSLFDLSILKVMERIYVPILHDSVSENKLEHFRNILTKDIYEGIPERITYVDGYDVGNAGYEIVKR